MGLSKVGILPGTATMSLLGKWARGRPGRGRRRPVTLSAPLTRPRGKLPSLLGRGGMAAPGMPALPAAAAGLAAATRE